MTSSLRTPRLVFLLLAILVSGTGAAMASGNPPMKQPLDGACEAPYVLFEGVCVLPAFMQGQPATIMQQIKEFKAASHDTAPEPAITEEDPLCARYRKILENSLNSGTMGYDPEKGKMVKTRGEATESVIKEAEEYLINFCNP